LCRYKNEHGTADLPVTFDDHSQPVIVAAARCECVLQGVFCHRVNKMLASRVDKHAAAEKRGKPLLTLSGFEE
jgi:hypothetical protein